MNTQEIHFISIQTTLDDISSLLGPMTGDEKFDVIDAKDTLAHIMFKSGVFRSVSDAKRNGWNRTIPYGYSEYIDIGKFKKRIYIVNL